MQEATQVSPWSERIHAAAASGHELFNQKLDMPFLVYKALINQSAISGIP